jgi:hypothetical protein
MKYPEIANLGSSTFFEPHLSERMSNMLSADLPFQEASIIKGDWMLKAGILL